MLLDTFGGRLLHYYLILARTLQNKELGIDFICILVDVKIANPLFHTRLMVLKCKNFHMGNLHAISLCKME